MSKKILFVIDSLCSGGAQRQLIELSLGIKKNNYHVEFLVYHDESFFQDILDEEKILIKIISETSYIKRLIKMRKYIRSGGYYGVISFLQSPNIICELAGFPWRSWKLIVGERSSNPNILKSPKLFVYRWFHLFATYIVSNSHSNLELVKKINPLLSNQKCKVLYNIIDFEKWKMHEKDINYNRDLFTLVVVAGHHKNKNIHGLVEAVSLLTNLEQAKLRIEWYGDKRSFNMKSITEDISEKKLNSIFSFYPETKQIKEKMINADAIGLFSYYEGLPNVICEGMALGRTVICSNVSDIPKILGQDSKYIFDPQRPESIKIVLSALLNMDKTELLNNGLYNRHLASNHFNANVIIGEYLRLLNNEI
jgi:glycosyltransferase involved in cell wall biosynthesis